MNFSPPSLREAGAALKGFGRVLRLDAEFVLWFDLRPEGALRSFGLAMPILPFFFMSMLLNTDLPADVGTTIDGVRLIAATLIVFVLSWILFPLALILIGKLIERDAKVAGAICFYNWLGAGLTFVQAALELLTYTGLAGVYPSILGYLIWLAALFFEGWALRHLLGLAFGGAFLLVLLDVMIAEGLFEIWRGLVEGRLI